jgi:glycosyltransferase involved in cell wall biosynthesis
MDRPRHLVVTTVAATIAGFLVPYAQHLTARGWRVEAAARGAPDDPRVVAAFDAVHDLTISRSLRDITRNVAAFSRLTEILGSGFDIVHVHTPIAGFVVRAAARQVPRRARPAIVYTAHGFHFHRDGVAWTNALFLTAERVAGRWTDTLVVINREDEEAASRHRIVPPRRLAYMPGIGIDPGHYSRAALAPERLHEARADLGLGADVPLVTMVGELNRNKRPGDVLAAVSRLRHGEAHLVILGDGPARPSLEARAIDLGLRGRVTFAGTVADVRPIVATSFALVLASKREGLPRSILEALALEVPVVSSAARGSVELVGTDAGVIAPIGDVDAIARALDRLLDDPSSARQMGVRGRAKVMEKYDIEKLLVMHDELYDRLLAARRR